MQLTLCVLILLSTLICSNSLWCMYNPALPTFTAMLCKQLQGFLTNVRKENLTNLTLTSFAYRKADSIGVSYLIKIFVISKCSQLITHPC